MSSLNTNSLSSQKHINDRYHNSKLQQIKNSRSRDKDKFTRRFIQIVNTKGKLKQLEKQQEINRENAILFTKLNSILNKPTLSTSTTLQKSRNNKFIFQEKREPNIEQNSHYSYQKLQEDWKQQKTHSKIASRQLKNSRSRQGIQKEFESIEYNQNKRSFDETLQFFEDLGLGCKEEKELEEPESMAERIIVYRKACVINQMSYLIEISTAYKRVFIIGHNMMNSKSRVVKAKMSQEKAKQTFSLYDYDFDLILNNITIQGSKIAIKLPPLRNQTLTLSHDDDNTKETIAYQKQTRFIRRNYYDAVDKIKRNITKYHQKMFKPQNQNNEDIRRRFCSMTVTKEQPENDSEVHETVFKHYKNEIESRSKGYSVMFSSKKKERVINRTESNIVEERSQGLLEKKRGKKQSIEFEAKEKTTKQNSQVMREHKTYKINEYLKADGEEFRKNNEDCVMDGISEINRLRKQLLSRKEKTEDKKATDQESPKSSKSQSHNNYNDDFEDQNIDQVLEEKQQKAKMLGHERNDDSQGQKSIPRSKSKEISLDEDIEEEYIDDFQQV